MRRTLLIVGVVVAVTASGVAYAAVKDGNGVIHGCYNNATFALRVVTTTSRCPTGTTALNWSAAGPRGPQGVAGPQGPAGAQGAAGPQGATGAVGQPGQPGARGAAGARGAGGLRGAAGQRGAQGPRGLTGAAGRPGAAGVRGVPGAPGPSGVLGVATFGGALPVIAHGAGSFLMVGGVATVRVAAGQRLTGSAVAVLRSTTGPVEADLGLCLSDGRGVPVSLNGADFLTVQVATQGRASYAVTGSTVVPRAGSYRVGLCVRNTDATDDLDANDWSTGWVMTTA